MQGVASTIRVGSIEAQCFATAQDLGQVLAKELAGAIQAARDSRRKFYLGCPGGRSLRSTYQALGKHAGEHGLSMAHVTVVMMDDYVVPAYTSSRFRLCDDDAHYSCARFAKEEIQEVLNAGLPPGERISDDQIWLPQPGAPLAYEDQIRVAGGIDVFLLASGATDGHVAFNPPGSALNSRTRVVPLAETTRFATCIGILQVRSAADKVAVLSKLVGVRSRYRALRAAASKRCPTSCRGMRRTLQCFAAPRQPSGA